MQQFDMERIFDGIYHKTIPLILFSFLEDQRLFTDLLSSLYDAMYRNDETSFQEIYNKLNNKISNRNSFGSHKEILIKVFSDRFLSLDQRIKNIHKIYLDFQPKIEQIDKDHINLKGLGKSFKRINPTINALKRKCLLKSDVKNTTSDVSRFNKENIDKPTRKRVNCPNCNNIINTIQGIGGTTYCRKCKKNFRIKEFR